ISNNNVPIWTFDYLRNAAVNLTQMAINAERDFVNFQDRAEQSALTKQELLNNVVNSFNEVVVQALQTQAARAEVDVYTDAVTLANQRATDAQDNVDEYRSLGAEWAGLQAASSQVSGGDDGDPNQLNHL